MFDQYDKRLSASYSDDYWSDEGISICSGLVSNFSRSDWDNLERCILHKPIPWIIRCAETLGDVVDQRSFDSLLKILAIDDHDVRIAALDSINSLYFAGFNISGYSDFLRDLIDSFDVSKLGNVDVALINSFKKNIGQ